VTAWWHALYDDLLADMLLERADRRETERTLDFLAGVLDLEPGARVFDQCCGIGSLAIPLARRGYRVVGCDLAAGYIERARRDAPASLELHAADAFEFVPAPCDGAFNWWTSFGYADEDAQNIRMLARAFEALKAGGRFALDFMNVPGVLHRFREEVVTRRGEVELVRRSAVDPAAMVMDKTWTYALPNGERVVHTSRVRLYTPRELGDLLARAGFVDVRFHGDIDRSPLALESPRCIAVARKPG
jgi:SAM-dependent methyltransferase